ncbi:MAG: hypothetical protein Q9216_002111 [Gyalolechia sp. 2 TL-2023]
MDVLPSTPDRSQALPAFHRSFTAPSRSGDSPRSSPSTRQAVEEEAETLYAHNAGKIVSFNPPFNGTRRHSSVEQGYSALQDEPVGTLPWASPTERTIAAGSLRIYRVLGSVAFLHSGTRLLKPILSKSQCWCVDGESKFVLQAGPHTYYRIELPYATAEDRVKVEEFKGTLGKVLQYETTPCPFKRGFTVNLPEKPKTPVRKKPWRPRERPQPAQAKVLSERSEHKLRQWEKPSTLVGPPPVARLDKDGEEESIRDYTGSGLAGNAESSGAGHDSESTDDSELTPTNPSLHSHPDLDHYKTPTRARPLKTGRAITAPPHLSLCTTSPSKSASEDLCSPDALEETSSLSSSIDSFHSFHSPISPLPPSPRFPQLSLSPPISDDEGVAVQKTRNHKRDDSELTVIAEPERIQNASEPPMLQEALDPVSPELPQTPTLISDSTAPSEGNSPEAITPCSVQLRRRTKHSRERSQSPPPSPANIYSPSARLSGHHLTTAILQKTCSMLLGPPISLVALMLNIASRIMNGTYDGFPFNHTESGRKLPGSWYPSDTDQVMEEEDDYGCALDKLPSSRSSSRSRNPGASWEID